MLPLVHHCLSAQAIAPRQGESVTELHSRYTAALLAVGKQHGVKLQIVE